MNSFFDNLYNKFLFRDLLGKAMPGFILILGTVAMLKPDWLSEIMPTRPTNIVYYFVIYGVSFSTGMLIQTFSLIRLLWRCQSGQTRVTQLKKLFNFHTRKDHEQVLVTEQRERLVVLKDMTGNLGMSLLVLAFVAWSCYPNDLLGTLLFVLSLLFF